MGKFNVRPPSKVDALAFPVFGLTWYGSPCGLDVGGGIRGVGGAAGCSAVAYSGGGGSAKTGVGNKIIVDVASEASFGATKRYEINTGEQLCFGVHAYRPYDDRWNMVRVLAAVGDEVFLYGVPLGDDKDDDLKNVDSGSSAENNGSEEKKEDSSKDCGVILLGNVNVGKSYGGCNVLSYTPLHHAVAVGCENGSVMVYRVVEDKEGHPVEGLAARFQKATECKGHTKAVCAVAFHPRGTHVLSGAKDGTARVFNTADGSETAVLTCRVDDPNKPAAPKPAIPTTGPGGRKIDPRMIKKAPMILVRGCGYGDLEGKVIYTVASGKRGPAYLTKWKALVPLHRPPSTMLQQPQSPGRPPTQLGQPPMSPQQPPMQPPPAPGVGPAASGTISFREEFRIKCSPVPISATSFSGDASVLAMGSVEGAILLYDLEKRKILKSFEAVHDLPVTCIAARPVSRSLPLPGEDEGGVTFDAISASADNRLGRWTLQKKSLKKMAPSPSQSSSSGGVAGLFWRVLRLPVLLLALLAATAVKDSYEVCGDQVWGPAIFDRADVALECLRNEVLWAEDHRPGVRETPT